MPKKLLIANRGEIACRIIKTAKRMGMRTVAVYSEADASAMHVQMADESMYLGPAASKASYLRSDKIIEVAKDLDVDLIHPGYGFLSENAGFADECQSNQLIFVGPPASAIEAMGSKSRAKALMQNAGVPLVPGYHGDNQDAHFLKQQAAEIGYPVLLKAAAGGGGKGMRKVDSESEFNLALETAKREAMASFGDDLMLVEKYVVEPRHVEFQVFCDQQGNGVYLFERDCSLQRRHQKVIEEAPAPGLSEDLRQRMGDAAVAAAKAINYVGAGTVEFLLDARGDFYFMEMNTRLQVEHPVTEYITNQDLVEWQLRVAQGEPLPLNQRDLAISGHAFEARIYAEDPENDFLPASGPLNLLVPPAENEHVRVDTGVRQGDNVSVHYDPMIAKLVVWDEDRSKALSRLAGALRDYRIDGVSTNLEFLYSLATHKSFKQEDINTHFIDEHHDSLFNQRQEDKQQVLTLGALAVLLNRASANASRLTDTGPWALSQAWRANEVHREWIELEFGGETHSVWVEQQATSNSVSYTVGNEEFSSFCQGELNDSDLLAVIDGHRLKVNVNIETSRQANRYKIFTDTGAFAVTHQLPDLGDTDEHQDDQGYVAPMNGTVVTLLVEPGDQVEANTPLIVIEAMKMEHSIKAAKAGKVTEFYFQPGDLVDGGAALLDFEAVE